MRFTSILAGFVIGGILGILINHYFHTKFQEMSLKLCQQQATEDYYVTLLGQYNPETKEVAAELLKMVDNSCAYKKVVK